MQRTSLIVAVLVIVASLVGASGPALAQSDDEIVTLTITTVIPSSNQQVGGVTLVATWNGGEERVTTASNGKVFIDVPEGASVEIIPDDDQYTRNEAYRIRVATEKEHTIDVARKADLDVVVSDAEGPVQNARVSLVQDGIEVVSGQTDSDGLYRSGTVAQGEYTLSVVKAGYYRTTENVVVAGSPERSVAIERGRVDYDVIVEDPHFDPARSVADAAVAIDGVGERVTDDRGTVSLLLPVNSEVQMTVSKEEYETVTETVSTNESEGSIALSLSREPMLSLSALNERVVVGEAVPVEVTNAYGEPAANVAILVDGERVAQTDGNGQATVRIEEAGDRSLQARGGGTTSEPVTVRGIGEGSGEGGQAQTTDASGQETGTTAADDSGAGSGALTGLLGPLVALGALLVVLVLGVLYWRRRSADKADPSAWADDSPTAGGGGSGAVDFGADASTEGDASADAGIDEGDASPGAETDTSTDAETGTSTEGDTSPGTETDTSTDAETDASSEGDASTDAETDTSTEGDASTETKTDTSTDADASAETDASADTDTGADGAESPDDEEK